MEPKFLQGWLLKITIDLLIYFLTGQFRNNSNVTIHCYAVLIKKTADFFPSRGWVVNSAGKNEFFPPP